jgi:hypothetical protein
LEDDLRSEYDLKNLRVRRLGLGHWKRLWGGFELINSQPFKLFMPTIFRQDGFRVVIYTDDHEPPHVHVLKGETEVKIDLGNAKTLPNVILLRGKRSDATKALEIVIDRQTELLEAWRMIHGN